MTPELTVGAATSSVALRLQKISSTPQLDCQLLLAHVLEVDRSWIYAHTDDILAPASAEAFNRLIKRRESGEPLAYITGHQAFWDMTLEVDSSTLIPRPETERLVELVLEKLPSQAPLSVADLGTGSGGIAIALARERATWQITATDVSTAALAVAKRNAERAGTHRIAFECRHWLDDFAAESLDAIVSNPPYIRERDRHLGDLSFEPTAALVSGEDGLDDIRNIVNDAFDILVTGGMLFIEHGYDQQPEVQCLMSKRGFAGVEGFKDLASQPRVTIGVKP